KESVPLAAAVRRKLNNRLSSRVGTAPTGSPSFAFPIDLQRAVRRREPHRLLHDWWNRNETRGGAVIGEEGMGKSWAAADFVNDLATKIDALVLWFES